MAVWSDAALCDLFAILRRLQSTTTTRRCIMPCTSFYAVDPSDDQPHGTIEWRSVQEYVAAGGDVAALRDEAAAAGDDPMVDLLNDYLRLSACPGAADPV